MCWFRKKDKERIALLEEKIIKLENSIQLLSDDNYLLYGRIVQEAKKREELEHELEQIKIIINYHIQNDMDMTEGDEIKWEEN
jgi:hypothetical protein